MQTDTKLGYRYLIMSSEASVTWPKTTATQKSNTVLTTTLKLSAQAKDLICKKTLQSGAWAGLGQWGGCKVSCGPRQLSSSQLRNHRKAEDGGDLWRSPGPTSLLKQSLLLKQTPRIQTILGPCLDDFRVSAHMETPPPLLATYGSAPFPWHYKSAALCSNGSSCASGSAHCLWGWGSTDPLHSNTARFAEGTVTKAGLTQGCKCQLKELRVLQQDEEKG